MINDVPLFTQWESFYVIVGSSGAALTGLQFVVMALVADAKRIGSSDTVGAFGTPTVVHFCSVLGIASVLSAPWQSTRVPSLVLALSAVAGIGYAIVVTLRARSQKDYKPVLEDWIWHSILPIIMYATLLVGALSMGREVGAGLFEIAATSLMLLFIGIHNAWDSIAYVATQKMKTAD